MICRLCSERVGLIRRNKTLSIWEFNFFSHNILPPFFLFYCVQIYLNDLEYSTCVFFFTIHWVDADILKFGSSCSNNENCLARQCQDSERSKRVYAGMRERIHIVHHKRRFVYIYILLWLLFRYPNFSISASEKCQQEKRKTVNGEDILFAMTSLGFENYAEALKIYLSKYREVSTFFFFFFLLLFSSVRLSFVAWVWQDENNLNNQIDWFETQSSRGENQNRPPSSGYSTGGPVGGGVPGAPGASSAGPSGFPVPSENPNNLLSPNMNPNEQDTTAYGYPHMVGATHNGAGGETY